MIKEFVAAWDSNKDKLKEYIKTHKQEDYETYKDLLIMLISIVINPYFRDVLMENIWDTSRITTIDDGDYQGDQIFLVPKETYQPGIEDYFWTHQVYGSCSGCDLLLSISGYDYDLPTDVQVGGYMMLALHLLQRCRYMLSEEEAAKDF